MELKRGIGLGLIATFGLVASYILIKIAIGPAAEEKWDLGAISSNADLVKIGQKIFFGKGQCALCHTMEGGRGKCPDLEGVGARLTREFIYETLTKPDAYIRLDFYPAEPKKYPARMPAVNKPPIALSEEELLTVIAFIQSQGGKVTVTPAEVGKRQGSYKEEVVAWIN